MEREPGMKFSSLYFADLKAMAEKLPKATDEEVEGPHKEPYQFGNNFFHLFEAIRREREHVPISIHGTICLREARKFEAGFKKFIAENAGLIDDIEKALPAIHAHKELYNRASIASAKDPEMAERIKELQVNSIGIAAWNKLNPLLKAAADRMELCGVGMTSLLAGDTVHEPKKS